MWEMVRRLRESGVTIILTTHYIEEAQEMADRIGVIRKGEIILVEEKHALMAKLGKRQLALTLKAPLPGIPTALDASSWTCPTTGTSWSTPTTTRAAGKSPGCCMNCRAWRSNSPT